MTQKSFFPINLEIIKNLQKLLHNIVGNTWFYLNMQYLKKIVLKLIEFKFIFFFVFWSSYIFSKNLNSKYSLHNFVLHIMLNPNMQKTQKSTDKFLS